MGTSDSKPGGFTVTDRRSFAGSDQTGFDKESPARAAETPASAEPDPILDEEGRAAADGSVLPAVDFHTFVLSLGSSALLHLGELEHPDGGESEKDLPLAKHTIDILSMLEAKTKGNLTSAEEKLIESLLYDLRLRFVNASK